ncbi:MAG: hypothetical protein EBU15_15015, partial [Betaproteobacteria bacterium]|nr:hypothetical protein [Betaproteobacteria bacterium]
MWTCGTTTFLPAGPTASIDFAAAGHGGKNLVSFVVTDNGAFGSSRIFLAAATAQVGAPGQIPLGAADSDGDGIPDSYELGLPSSTKPDDVDTDGDGLSDGVEIAGTSNPLVADTDGDGLNDGQEATLGTNPLLADTDGDGLNDNVETKTGTYVSGTDTGTDPTKADTDGDGANDGTEVKSGTNPLLIPSFPVNTFSVAFNGTSTQRVISPRPVQDDFTFSFWIKTSAAGTGSTH